MMKQSCFALFFIALLCFGQCTRSTERHPDCPANLQRVVRLIDLDFAFNLVGDNTWHQFPEMFMNVNIPYAQFVKFKVNLQIKSNAGDGILVSRLMIDNKEIRQFRCHTGFIWHHNHHTTGQLWLEAGRHQIKVEYRCTPILVVDTSKADWGVAIFKVEYYEQN